jgi:2-polyprenyl-3-methyl-5-hydroxy-6-metoxy-1,4-benzoquinol methylase
MPENVMECPLCASRASRLFDRRYFHDREVINCLCLNCGLVYQSPRMTETETAEFYAEEYRLVQEGNTNPTARNMSAQEGRAKSLVDFIMPVLPVVSRHLDIGCSLGILIQHVRARYQNQSVGVEPGEMHRLLAQKKGLKIYPSLQELERSGETNFDLISLSHVLEHLPDPVGYLTHLREFQLSPGGVLLLEVPNLYAHDSFEVAHLCAFSSHTLMEVLRRSGFEIIKIIKHGQPNSSILPLFLTSLCRPAAEPDLGPVRPEHGVAWKRQIGMLRRQVLGWLFPSQAWLKVREER